MATKLPYVVWPGTITRILNKIKEAKTPDRFTHDFLATKLGFKGGNARQFLPLAKKLSLLNSDGSPTELYKKFRNNDMTGAAMAQAIKTGYREIFERNEYAHELSKDKLKGLIVEITGLETNSKVVQLICQTFVNLKTFADFEAKPDESSSEDEANEEGADGGLKEAKEFGLNLAYTINLVLPKTDDPAVFNAIFRALRENLLRK